MATQTLERNIIGFRSGMHKGCSGYAKSAFAMRAAAPQEAASGLADHSVAAGQMLALPDQNFSLVCLAGELWLTRDGDVEDYILGPGQQFAVRRGDGVAVQALKPSRVRLSA
ncbi:MAG: DUF2917 domain-containing protein [Sulfuritalea sp.]|nr:DUF2917 domain-containing protein [Sulfuritalea sp.]